MRIFAFLKRIQVWSILSFWNKGNIYHENLWGITMYFSKFTPAVYEGGVRLFVSGRPADPETVAGAIRAGVYDYRLKLEYDGMGNLKAVRYIRGKKKN